MSECYTVYMCTHAQLQCHDMLTNSKEIILYRCYRYTVHVPSLLT